MAFWQEDLSNQSMEELTLCQDENRAWGRDLRVRSAALVNQRLAKEISLEEYTSTRKSFQQDAAECSRRAAVLADAVMSLAGMATH